MFMLKQNYQTRCILFSLRHHSAALVDTDIRDTEKNTSVAAVCRCDIPTTKCLYFSCFHGHIFSIFLSLLHLQLFLLLLGPFSPIVAVLLLLSQPQFLLFLLLLLLKQHLRLSTVRVLPLGGSTLLRATGAGATCLCMISLFLCPWHVAGSSFSYPSRYVPRNHTSTIFCSLYSADVVLQN